MSIFLLYTPPHSTFDLSFFGVNVHRMEHRHTTSKEAYTFLITCTLVKRILSFLPPEKKKKKNPRMDELMCRRREKREEMNEERPIGSLSCFGFKIDGGPPTVSLLEVDWVRVPTLYCNIKCTPAGRESSENMTSNRSRTRTNRRRERKADRTLGFTVNFLVEFVGSIKVLKEKQTKKLRPYVYAMYALFSRRFPSANLANVGSSGFYVHPSLAGPIG